MRTELYPPLKKISGQYGYLKRTAPEGSDKLQDTARRMTAVKVATYAASEIEALGQSFTSADLDYIVSQLEALTTKGGK